MNICLLTLEILVRTVRGRRPFFLVGHRGLPCESAVPRARGRGGSGGAREDPVAGYTEAGIVVKIDLDTTTTLLYYNILVVRCSTTEREKITSGTGIHKSRLHVRSHGHLPSLSLIHI